MTDASVTCLGFLCPGIIVYISIEVQFLCNAHTIIEPLFLTKHILTIFTKKQRSFN